MKKKLRETDMTKKLRFSRETICVLSRGDLPHVVGGTGGDPEGAAATKRPL